MNNSQITPDTNSHSLYSRELQRPNKIGIFVVQKREEIRTITNERQN